MYTHARMATISYIDRVEHEHFRLVRELRVQVARALLLDEALVLGLHVREPLHDAEDGGHTLRLDAREQVVAERV